MQESILTLLKDFYNTIKNDGETGYFRVQAKSKSYKHVGYSNDFIINYNNLYDTQIDLTYSTYTNSSGKIEKTFTAEYSLNDGYMLHHLLVLDTPEEIFQQSVVDIPVGYDGILSEENTAALQQAIKTYLTEYAVDVF